MPRFQLLGSVALVLALSPSMLPVSADNTSSEPANQAKIERVQEIKNGVSETKYEIKVRYPLFPPKGGVSRDAINDMIRKAVLSVVQKNEEDFKQHKAPSPEMSSYLSGTFKICLDDANIVSTRLTFEAYKGGFAHPWSWTQDLNYQVNPPSEITLDNLFKPGAEYLRTISDLCVQELEQKLDKSNRDPKWIREGAGPSAGKLNNFCIHKSSLEFTFDEASIAARYLGPQSVTIPFSKTRQLLNPQSPVYKLAEESK